jgi:O-6-methylguanine DNA methyltransferase
MRIQDESLFTAFLKTPIGLLMVRADHQAIREISFQDDLKKTDQSPSSPRPKKGFPPHLIACLTQLREYFKGRRKKFDLPLNLIGTAFQKRVWSHLQKVPYGKTRSYQELAVAIGQSNASRAVGGANHRNPVVIVVPCHRIIGADGALTGYGGGLWRKQWLLEFERNH